MRSKLFWTGHFLACLGIVFNAVFALEDGEIIKEKNFDRPVREISVIASKEGFYPERLTAFVGEKVKFFVTSSTDKPSCFFLQEKELFLSAEKGQVHTAEAYFDKEGVYDFYCPNGKIKGRLSVIERPDDKRRRQIASEMEKKRVRVWHPREE